MKRIGTRSNEAFWWSLFSAGGVMSALFVPVLIVLTGFVLPFVGDSATNYRRVSHALSFWVVRIVLLGVVTLSFFHCAHRIRHVLPTVGLRMSPGLLAVVCYGTAFAGAVATFAALVRL
jgi:fumarate reductase subunit D